MKIAVAGTGYVCLSIATLLSQHNEVGKHSLVLKKCVETHGIGSPRILRVMKSKDNNT